MKQVKKNCALNYYILLKHTHTHSFQIYIIPLNKIIEDFRSNQEKILLFISKTDLEIYNQENNPQVSKVNLITTIILSWFSFNPITPNMKLKDDHNI